MYCAVVAVMLMTCNVQLEAQYIDGKKNPELIPFDMALGMMFVQCADGREGWDLVARLTYLDKSGLTREEKLIVIDASNKAMAEHSAYGRALQKLPRPRKQAEIDRLTNQVIQSREDTRKWLEQELGPASYAKLEYFINTKVKSETSIGAEKVGPQ